MDFAWHGDDAMGEGEMTEYVQPDSSWPYVGSVQWPGYLVSDAQLQPSPHLFGECWQDGRAEHQCCAQTMDTEAR